MNEPFLPLRAWLIQLHTFDAQFQLALDLRSPVISAPASRVDGVALRSGAASSSYAVNEVLSHLRQVIVDHVGDVIHVQAARGDIGGDQHAVRPS